MPVNRSGASSVFAWLCPIVLVIALAATGVMLVLYGTTAPYAAYISMAGMAVALVLGGLYQASNVQVSRSLLTQLAKLSSLQNEYIEPEQFEQQLHQSKLPPQARRMILEIYQTLESDQDSIGALQQKSARSEVRAHLAESRVSEINCVIEGLTEPVIMVDQYGELALINPAAVTLMGMQDVAVGTRIDDALPCDSIVQLLNETRRRKLKSSRVAEIELADPAGEKHWYRITVNTVADDDNESGGESNFGAVAVMRDISGYKAIQRRNAEFVSAVSHEMKTPLAGIKAYTELLADGEAEDEETRDEFLGVISGQADRLQRLIDNLLNLARIEAGVVSVSKKPRSLNDLLDEAAAIVQPTAEQKNITLNVELSPMYLGVLADRDMILQAAINLLSNAIKYTPDGGKVTLRSRLSDREVHFEVEDTGVGLSPEDCEMVFEKFYRVKKDQKMASGTGLGLPLAKHIVEDVHGGTLTVKSELNHGSTFMIALPTVQVIEHAS
ncbi:PAS domain-containing sensor histidine kinase [Bremerella cremea]|uniref:sensor histidine kinase n=1 Tax=Bremerella cremea TaxID=1031537 RepID=UPI0031F0514E